MPGRIFDERSLGPNALIRDGAALGAASAGHPRALLPRARRASASAPAGPRPAAPAAEPRRRRAAPGSPGAILADARRRPPDAAAPEELAARARRRRSTRSLGALLELELRRLGAPAARAGVRAVRVTAGRACGSSGRCYCPGSPRGSAASEILRAPSGVEANPMAKNLVIVESPAKTRTLKKFLGRDYAVEASLGHIRDLRARRTSGIGADYEPHYAGPRRPRRTS